MADGKIVIDARINKKAAEADLKTLKQEVASTAKEISRIDAALAKVEGKKSTLSTKLEQAKAQADKTAASLDEINARLDKLRNQKPATYKGMEITPSKAEMAATQKEIDALTAQSDKIAAKWQKENATVESLNQQYQALEQTSSELQGKRAGLEQTQANQQEAVGNQQVQVDSSNQELAQAEQVASIASAFSECAKKAQMSKKVAEAFHNVLSSIGRIGKTAFSVMTSPLKKLQGMFTSVHSSVANIAKRITGLAARAMVFNVVSSGLRTMSSWMQSALMQTSAMQSAMANLKGAASTAAAPIIQILTPALAQLANAAATVFNYLARLISFFTGKTISASASAAKAMNGVSSAASGTANSAEDAAEETKKANGELAAFDDLNVLNKQDDTSSSGDTGGGGGGGGSDDLTPNYDFSGSSPFLDDLLAAIEAGNWYEVGNLIGEKLRDSLNSIPWETIQTAAANIATNLANLINGFIETEGLWESIGHTIAQGLNTALIFVDTLMQTINWAALGAGFANGLQTAIDEIQWDTLGRVLTDGLRAAILTAAGFVATFTGWAQLGSSIATMLNSAVENIPWEQATLAVSGGMKGVLTTLTTAVQEFDWAGLGQDIVGFIGGIDWAGIIGQASELLVSVLDGINALLEQIDWNEVLNTIGECLAAVDWGELMSQIGQLILNSLPIIGALLLAQIPALIGTLFSTIIMPAIGQWLLSVFTTTVLPAIAEGLAAIVAAIGLWPAVLIAALVALFVLIIAVVVNHWEEIKTGWNDFWTAVSDKLSEWGENIKAAWDGFWLTIQLVAAAVWEAITTAWDDFWTGVGSTLDSWGESIKTTWGNLWDGLKDLVKQPINGIIGFVNKMISAIADGINGIIDLINGFSFDVPEFAQGILGTSKIGFDIEHVTAPQIPLLAQGAVIPANHEFAAILGDQTSGTNIEAPLDTIKQALAEVMGSQQIEIRFTGTESQLIRWLQPRLKKENNRVGASMISGGAY